MAKKIRDERKVEKASVGERIVHPDGTVEFLSTTDQPTEEECVDATSADSFPASDPPAFTSITGTGKPKRRPTADKGH